MDPRTRDNASDSSYAGHCLACHLRLWITLALILTLDLVSKSVVFSQLGEPRDDTPGSHVVPGVLEFRTQYNQGAALGLLRGQRLLFLAVGGVALLVFLVFFARSKRSQWFFHIGVALVLSGALGNIYDRIVHEQVRDFIYITVQVAGRSIYPYIFNVADIALVIGVGMIMISWARAGRSKPAVRPRT